MNPKMLVARLIAGGDHHVVHRFRAVLYKIQHRPPEARQERIPHPRLYGARGHPGMHR
jgi:hypothetical protein